MHHPQIATGLSLSVPDDKLAAFLTFDPDLRELPSYFDIMEILNKAGIVFGIRKKLFRTKAALMGQLRNSPTIEVARGTLPKNGRDGYLSLAFLTDDDPRVPKNRPDGTVDFRDIGYLPTVRHGQLLAEKKSPTKAISGRNIFGEELAGTDGRELAVRHSKNVSVSQDGSRYYARCSGKPVFRDELLDVQRRATIEGDIDYRVGNINFDGHLTITGDVRQGFRVKTGGRLSVQGEIRGSIVSADGDMIVGDGIITGERKAVCGGKSIEALFVENSSVKVRRDLRIHRCIMHSYVDAGGSIVVASPDGTGCIIGGECSAGIRIIADEIGSRSGVKTVVSISFNPQYYRNDELYQHYLAVCNRQHNTEDTIGKAYGAIEQIKLSEKLTLAAKAGLIDAFGEKIFDYTGKLNHIREEAEDLRIFLLRSGYILEPLLIVQKVVWPGVTVIMNGTAIKITRPLKAVKLAFKEGRIVTENLEESSYGADRIDRL